MWSGTLLLPVSDDPLPKVGGSAFLHAPDGVHYVTVDDVTVDSDGMRIGITGMMSSDPGLTMASLEYELA
jgi:hypothetical protein